MARPWQKMKCHSHHEDGKTTNRSKGIAGTLFFVVFLSSWLIFFFDPNGASNSPLAEARKNAGQEGSGVGAAHEGFTDEHRVEAGAEGGLGVLGGGQAGLADEHSVGEGLPQGRRRGQAQGEGGEVPGCLLYTSPSPRDRTRSRMPSSA